MSLFADASRARKTKENHESTDRRSYKWRLVFMETRYSGHAEETCGGRNVCESGNLDYSLATFRRHESLVNRDHSFLDVTMVGFRMMTASSMTIMSEILLALGLSSCNIRCFAGKDDTISIVFDVNIVDDPYRGKY